MRYTRQFLIFLNMPETKINTKRMNEMTETM
jgi:hypothetical protein